MTLIGIDFRRKGVGIDQAFHIAPGAGIAIPVPRTANVAACFEGQHTESHVPQLVQRVQPAKAPAQHQGVKHLFFAQFSSLSGNR